MKTLADGTVLITGYIPKMALTGIAIALFGILAITFWYRFFRGGREKYMLSICIGTTTMTLGFAVRFPLTNNPGSLGIYIITTLLTLLSPCAFLAQDYVILPRLAKWLDAEDHLLIRANLIVKVFVWSDVATFLLRAAGGGMSAIQGESMQKAGLYIALVGLVIQCVSFMLFMLIALIFGYRIRKIPKWSTHQRTAQGHQINLRRKEDWRTLLYAILWTGIGIMIRCVFRVVEYAQRFEGTLRNTEWAFYVLDALPLFLAIAVWTYIWPPSVLSQQDMFADVPSPSSASTYALVNRPTPQYTASVFKSGQQPYA